MKERFGRCPEKETGRVGPTKRRSVQRGEAENPCPESSLFGCPTKIRWSKDSPRELYCERIVADSSSVPEGRLSSMPWNN